MKRGTRGDRLGDAEGEHGDAATVLLDDAYRLLDRHLLVRADREAKALRVNLGAVVGEHEPPTAQRHSLNADQDVHQERIRSFLGSNGAAAPTMSTVTG
jgi:hypothetical protein